MSPQLNGPIEPSRAALDRVRGALAAELESPPPSPWTKAVLSLIAVIAALFAVAAVFLSMTGAITEGLAASRLGVVALLLGVACFASYAAWVPGRRSLRVSALVLAGVGAVMVTLERTLSIPTVGGAEWLCTVSHIGVGVPPLLLAVALLRNAAPNPLRAVAAGLAAGTTGLALGQLACARSMAHVAGYHLTAWVAVAALTLVASRLTTPRSYAP